MFTALVVLLGSCSKDSFDAEKQAVKDDSLIVDFIARNNISAIKHPSGLYYQVLSVGNGGSVTAASRVTVNYEGKLLNGTTFDKSKQAITFGLNEVIPGWTIGVPLVEVGGAIRLIVPSSLAYGNMSPGAGIPKNSVLDFTIELINAQ